MGKGFHEYRAGMDDGQAEALRAVLGKLAGERPS
jgi:hypothetical protein